LANGCENCFHYRKVFRRAIGESLKNSGSQIERVYAL
jgi:hypothetical protein